MKTYISILLVILGLTVVVLGGYFYTKQNPQVVPQAQGDVRMKTYSSSVSRFFEGDNKIEYSFDIPEYATATIDMDGALIKITSTSSPYATIYISYEGGRGFTALDYINEIIAPHVSVINPKNISTIGTHTWQVAESEGSEWHIAPLRNNEWLFIVENRKVNHDVVEKTLESLVVN